MMKSALRNLLCTVVVLGAVTMPAFAALEIFTDNRSLFFGVMQLGETKILAQSGTYHNEITISSSEGRPWYLKISLLRPLGSPADTIPLESFSWQLTDFTGAGTGYSQSGFRSFSLVPDLVYASGSNEANGQPVRLRLRYRLQLPEAQTGGVYQTALRLTLTEVL